MGLLTRIQERRLQVEEEERIRSIRHLAAFMGDCGSRDCKTCNPDPICNECNSYYAEFHWDGCSRDRGK